MAFVSWGFIRQPGAPGKWQSAGGQLDSVPCYRGYAMRSGDSTARGMKPMTASLFRRHAVTAGLILALVPALPALAHPKLVNATPAADATAAATARLDLAFSEAMVPAMTSVTLAHMMGQMAHPIAATLRFAPDKRSVALVLVRPLPAGTYSVTWKSVGADTHKVSGSYRFTIR
jgi:copper resistance protein C